jgi:hypothetical protein
MGHSDSALDGVDILGELEYGVGSGYWILDGVQKRSTSPLESYMRAFEILDIRAPPPLQTEKTDNLNHQSGSFGHLSQK